jgi:hypothetical protein
MVPPSDDLDLSQAQAYALQPADLAELLGTVQASLSASLALLRTPADMPSLHRCLHDVKGYLGLTASAPLCQLVQQADLAARQGHESQASDLVRLIVPRLEGLQSALQAYRAGIIGD